MDIGAQIKSLHKRTLSLHQKQFCPESLLVAANAALTSIRGLNENFDKMDETTRESLIRVLLDRIDVWEHCLELSEKSIVVIK